MKAVFFFAFFCGYLGIFMPAFSKNIIVHENGYWSGEDTCTEHCFDPKLASALIQFFKIEKAHRIVDFGCGMGDYVKAFLTHELFCKGYDGNPNTYQLSKGVASVADLSKPLTLETYDWVMSLEVGEHLPKKAERTFIENLHRHNKKGIILSWAVKGQTGFGHVNEQNNDYIKQLMSEYGYVNDLEAEALLKKEASLRWFKNTLMVFRKNES